MTKAIKRHKVKLFSFFNMIFFSSLEKSSLRMLETKTLCYIDIFSVNMIFIIEVISIP